MDSTKIKSKQIYNFDKNNLYWYAYMISDIS